MLVDVKGAEPPAAPPAAPAAPATVPGSYTPELQVSSPSAGSGSDLPASAPAATHVSDAASVPPAVAPPPPLPTTGRTAARGGPSAYRGVVWHKSNSKWEARIYEGGKQKFLGYFTNEDTAAAAYDDAAARLHGSAAKLNFPERYQGVEFLPPAHLAPVSRAPAAGRTSAPRARPRAHAHASANADAPARRVQPVKGSSRFRGVSWNSNCSKWRAQVWKGSEVHHLGYFEREEDAARAYDEAVLRIRGPDAPTNYPKAHYGLPSSHDVLAAPVQRRKAGGRARAVFVADEEEEEEDEGKSRMLGVSWDDASQAWLAEIWDGMRYRSLGEFSTESEAARAYDVACLAQHGAEALTNFPLGSYERELAAATMVAIADDVDGAEELWGVSHSPELSSRRSASPAASGAEGTPAPAAQEGTPVPADARGASRFHGVSYDRRKGRWFSQIQIRGNRKFLGYFDTEEGAAAAYDAAALRLHGAAAVLNFSVPQAPVAVHTSAEQAGVLNNTMARLVEFISAQRQTLPVAPLPVAPAPPAFPAGANPAVAAVLQVLLARQQEASAAAARAAYEQQVAAQQRAAMALATALQTAQQAQAQTQAASAHVAGKRSYEELQAALASWAAAKKPRAA